MIYYYLFKKREKDSFIYFMDLNKVGDGNYKKIISHLLQKLEILKEKEKDNQKRVMEIEKENEELKKALGQKKLISVIFNNIDDNYLSVICKETDMFTDIEKKYYKRYPEKENKSNIFVTEEIKIDNSNKYKTLKDLNINDNTLIFLK